MLDLLTTVAIFATFLLAGMVKGVIGLGLPTVSLALLAVIVDLPSAMALLLIPSFVTNVWQAATGGGAGVIIRRIWPFLLAATATVWIGTAIFVRTDLALVTALLGTLLITYALINLGGLRPALSNRQEVWAGPVLGAVTGIFTGMTGSFVVPGVIFLQALDLPRDKLIQAMGMAFTLATLALALALGGNGILTADLALLSAVAVLPAIAGMTMGQRIRQHLSETAFRRVFFTALLALGVYIVIGAVSQS